MEKHCESGKRFGKEVKVRLMLVREGRAKSARVGSPKDAFDFMRDKARGLDREHFWRMDLDARNQVLGFEVVSIGTLTASLVHPREVFVGALLQKAAGVIVLHNHPSGEITPSPEDKETTRRLVKAGELLGVPVLDHLILGNGKYFSFKEGGLL